MQNGGCVGGILGGRYKRKSPRAGQRVCRRRFNHSKDSAGQHESDLLSDRAKDCNSDVGRVLNYTERQTTRYLWRNRRICLWVQIPIPALFTSKLMCESHPPTLCWSQSVEQERSPKSFRPWATWR